MFSKIGSRRPDRRFRGIVLDTLETRAMLTAGMPSLDFAVQVPEAEVSVYRSAQATAILAADQYDATATTTSSLDEEPDPEYCESVSADDKAAIDAAKEAYDQALAAYKQDYIIYQSTVIIWQNDRIIFNQGVRDLKTDVNEFADEYGDVITFTGEASVGTSGPDASLHMTVDWNKLNNALDRQKAEAEFNALLARKNNLSNSLQDLKDDRAAIDAEAKNLKDRKEDLEAEKARIEQMIKDANDKLNGKGCNDLSIDLESPPSHTFPELPPLLDMTIFA